MEGDIDMGSDPMLTKPILYRIYVITPCTQIKLK